MSATSSPTNEWLAEKAFSKQSVLFDDIYTNDTIIQYKRARVRAHVEKFMEPNSHILELNAGTGEDAVYFATKGHSIHATDISDAMLGKLADKVRARELNDSITHETCSYTNLENLSQKGPYHHIFSNFAGLNCTNQLDKVLRSLSPLVKKDGMITLVILPKFCLWEFLLITKGKFKTALRRFTGNKGASSHIEGEYFTCWYYNPSYIKRCLEKDFEHVQTEGLCSFVPPSYIAHFPERHPRVYSLLCRIENRCRFNWPWRGIGDYYIISFRKK
jgi:ubiquinone/menaquinone biosynthesis C-methylase UbiE